MSPQQMWNSVKQAQQAGGEQATVEITHELLRKHGLKAVMATLVHGLREFSAQWDDALQLADEAALAQDRSSRDQAAHVIARMRAG